jgi:hypothetical protein
MARRVAPLFLPYSGTANDMKSLEKICDGFSCYKQPTIVAINPILLPFMVWVDELIYVFIKRGCVNIDVFFLMKRILWFYKM